MCQIKITLSRPGYETTGVVLVQRDPPAKLLIGTDMLSQLGFLFVCAEQENEDVDLLESPAVGNGQEKGEVDDLALCA